MLEQVGKDAPSCLGVFRRAFASKSKGAAIKAFCLECLWMDRQAIRACTVADCPLWNVRPFQRCKGRKDAEMAGGGRRASRQRDAVPPSLPQGKSEVSSRD